MRRLTSRGHLLGDPPTSRGTVPGMGGSQKLPRLPWTGDERPGHWFAGRGHSWGRVSPPSSPLLVTTMRGRNWDSEHSLTEVFYALSQLAS